MPLSAPCAAPVAPLPHRPVRPVKGVGLVQETSTRLPTPCASGRIAGKICLAGDDVYLRSCCPPWSASTTSDAGGGFAFEALTVGTFTVTWGQQIRVVEIDTCASQVNVDLCP